MTKEEIKYLKETTKGKVLAETIRTHFNFIKIKYGEDGVKKVLNELKKIGFEIDLARLKPFDYVPTYLADLVILVFKETFSLNDKDIFEMGNTAPKYSLIAKLLMKYFISPSLVVKIAPIFWKRHFTEGYLESEYNGKEKYFKVKLYHNCYPVLCVFYAGYFQRIAQYVIKGKNFSVQETKCMAKGDPYHEFIIKFE
ncbi:MAG: V4R domain-containing protein [Minisyncoccia bacterium]